MEYPDQEMIGFNSDELERYSRHLSLPEIGLKGQKLLQKSSVLCIGCGGLGSPLLTYLAAAGVGRIGIVYHDSVDKSNLQRQIIHGTNTLGQDKVQSANKRIQEINPHCKVETYKLILSKENALETIQSFDLVCDCTDNFEARYLINDACIMLKKPNIYGSIARFEGQATVFNLNEESPSFRDLIPDPPPKNLMPSCSEAGVIGVLPGLIGIIQATEAIKIITGIGDTLNGRLLVFNALTMKFRELKLRKNYPNQKIKELIDYKDFCSDKSFPNEDNNHYRIGSISVHKLRKLIKSNRSKIILIDVRSYIEFKINSLDGAISIPLNEINNQDVIKKLEKLSFNKEIYLFCETGERSLKAQLALKKSGINGINLKGGLKAWNRDNTN